MVAKEHNTGSTVNFGRTGRSAPLQEGEKKDGGAREGEKSEEEQRKKRNTTPLSKGQQGKL